MVNCVLSIIFLNLYLLAGLVVYLLQLFIDDVVEHLVHKFGYSAVRGYIYSWRSSAPGPFMVVFWPFFLLDMFRLTLIGIWRLAIVRFLPDFKTPWQSLVEKCSVWAEKMLY